MIFKFEWKLFFVTFDENAKKISSPAVTVAFFTHSPQYKKFNIAYFILAVSSKINKTNEVCNLEMQYSYGHWYAISHLLTAIGTNKKWNCKQTVIQSWQ